jgi:hypothetical protein
MQGKTKTSAKYNFSTTHFPPSLSSLMTQPLIINVGLVFLSILELSHPPMKGFNRNQIQNLLVHPASSFSKRITLLSLSLSPPPACIKQMP